VPCLDARLHKGYTLNLVANQLQLELQLDIDLLSALLIALREGVEAALIVGIVLVYLNRSGRRALARYVWAAVALATVASAGVAALLARWQVSEDGFEGALLLVAAAFVISMVVWMNRVARRLRKDIEQRVESIAGGAANATTRAAGWGLFLFVFLMVVREGAELALILRAVEFSAAGINVWVGTFLGLAIAIAVGLFFFQGTLRVPLGRFFAVTTGILMVVAFQLALTGVHELSEAQWIASSQQEMRIVGPIVRNDVFFFVVILGAAAILILREWFAASHDKAAPPASEEAGSAERRRIEWERRRQRRWMFAASLLCATVIVALTADFVYARQAAAPPGAEAIFPQQGALHIFIPQVDDGNVHFYQAREGNTAIRFFVIRKPGGWGVALDACRICGRAGYRQDGQNVICRNCSSAIYIPSIGDAGGCNPVGVGGRVEGTTLVVEMSALQQAEAEVPH
jgi:high-affinity iron transporter